MAGVAVFTETK